MEDSSLIAARVQKCFDGFRKACTSLAKADISIKRKIQPGKVNDELGRFRLWCGNVAAHRRGRSSLDYKLREASHIRAQVIELLEKLDEVIGEANEIISGERLSWEDFSESDSESDLDASDNGHPHDAETEATELQQLSSNIAEIVTCLMRLSMAIRNPAPHDQFKESTHIDTSHFEAFDVEHVRSKFPRAEEYLVNRLGKAISRRRHYLRYRDEHQKKLKEGLQHTDAPAEAATPDINAPRTVAASSQKIESTVASSIPHALKTSRSTIDLDDSDYYEDTLSQTSFASSTNDSTKLRPPPLPAEGQDGNPFECSLCFRLTSVRQVSAWRKHIYRDLHPYICSYRECKIPDSIYESRHEWFSHEVHAHRLWYECVEGCNLLFTSRTEIRHHLQAVHPAWSNEARLDDVVRNCERHTSMDMKGDCPLCQQTFSSLTLLRRHLGKHHEELALFALPSHMKDEDDQGVEDEISDEDARSDEDVTSGKSGGSLEDNGLLDEFNDLLCEDQSSDEEDDQVRRYRRKKKRWSFVTNPMKRTRSQSVYEPHGNDSRSSLNSLSLEGPSFQENFGCDLCNEEFVGHDRQQRLTQHLSQDHFECLQHGCGLVYSDEDLLTRHIMEVHKYPPEGMNFGLPIYHPKRRLRAQSSPKQAEPITYPTIFPSAAPVVNVPYSPAENRESGPSTPDTNRERLEHSNMQSIGALQNDPVATGHDSARKFAADESAGGNSGSVHYPTPDKPPPSSSRVTTTEDIQTLSETPDTMVTALEASHNSSGGLTESHKHREQHKGTDSQKAILSVTIAMANTAVLLDHAGDLERAMEAYKDSCTRLVNVSAQTSNEFDQNKLESIRRTYIARMEELRQVEPSLTPSLDAEKHDQQSVSGTPKEPKNTINFKDAANRNYCLPWDHCKIWENMQRLIKHMHPNNYPIGRQVERGHYDVMCNGRFVDSQDWEDTVQPGCYVAMYLWSAGPTRSKPDTAFRSNLDHGASAESALPPMDHKDDFARLQDAKMGKQSSAANVTPLQNNTPDIQEKEALQPGPSNIFKKETYSVLVGDAKLHPSGGTLDVYAHNLRLIFTDPTEVIWQLNYEDVLQCYRGESSGSLVLWGSWWKPFNDEGEKNTVRLFQVTTHELDAYKRLVQDLSEAGIRVSEGLSGYEEEPGTVQDELEPNEGKEGGIERQERSRSIGADADFARTKPFSAEEQQSLFQLRSHAMLSFETTKYEVDKVRVDGLPSVSPVSTELSMHTTSMYFIPPEPSEQFWRMRYINIRGASTNRACVEVEGQVEERSGISSTTTVETKLMIWARSTEEASKILEFIVKGSTDTWDDKDASNDEEHPPGKQQLSEGHSHTTASPSAAIGSSAAEHSPHFPFQAAPAKIPVIPLSTHSKADSRRSYIQSIISDMYTDEMDFVEEEDEEGLDEDSWDMTKSGSMA